MSLTDKDELNDLIWGDSEPLDKKGRIFLYGIKDRVNESLDYLKSKYSKITDLNLAIKFITYYHSEAVMADIEGLSRIGYFPATEVEMEFDHSIKHALIGSYKSAFSDLRRAIELTLISVFLTSDQCDRKKAIDWVFSRSDTPQFSRSLEKLIKIGRYKDLNDHHNWKDNLQHLYWELSDYCHTKGQLKSYRELNNPRFFAGGSQFPSINFETLEVFSDLYIKTVGEIVVMQALCNPMILVGVSFDKKFGLNGPASGFFDDSQAELVHMLIPQTYKNFFTDMAKNDQDIKNVIEYFDSLPDLTKEEFEKQVKDFEEENKINQEPFCNSEV